jgi:Cytochrome c7 and related cytochrome c
MFERGTARCAIVAGMACLAAVVMLLAGCTSSPTPAATTTPTGQDGAGVSATNSTGSGSEGSSAAASQAIGGGQESLSPLSRVDRAKLTGNFARCPECHSLLDYQARKNPALVSAFSHSNHLQRGAKCDNCHLSPTHTAGEVRKPTMLKCFGCHSQSDASKPPGKCSTCHPANFPLKPVTHNDPMWLPPAAQLVSSRAKHAQTALQSIDACKLCHSIEDFCTKCHGVQMPHAADWKKTHPETAFKVGGTVCTRCHFDQQTCMACHHPGYKPGGAPWWKLHPQIVLDKGPETCLTCHSTLTCAHCHTTGEYIDYNGPNAR